MTNAPITNLRLEAIFALRSKSDDISKSLMMSSTKLVQKRALILSRTSDAQRQAPLYWEPAFLS